jgi:hypothetical protein
MFADFSALPGSLRDAVMAPNGDVYMAFVKDAVSGAIYRLPAGSSSALLVTNVTTGQPFAITVSSTQVLWETYGGSDNALYAAMLGGQDPGAKKLGSQDFKSTPATAAFVATDGDLFTVDGGAGQPISVFPLPAVPGTGFTLSDADLARPPLAVDAKGMKLWYAGTTSLHSISLAMVAPGATPVSVAKYPSGENPLLIRPDPADGTIYVLGGPNVNSSSSLSRLDAVGGKLDNITGVSDAVKDFVTDSGTIYYAEVTGGAQQLVTIWTVPTAPKGISNPYSAPLAGGLIRLMIDPSSVWIFQPTSIWKLAR